MINNIAWYAIKQKNGLYNIFYNIYGHHCHGVVETAREVEGVREEDVKRVLNDLSCDSDRFYDDDALRKFKEYENDSRANSE